MWFSGLRGAICFALALNIPSSNQGAIVTVTLVIVLFSILFLGGGTFPLLKFLNSSKNFIISKTDALGNPVTMDTAEEQNPLHSSNLDASEDSANVFAYFDEEFLKPFFRIKKTHAAIADQIQELQDIASTGKSRRSFQAADRASIPFQLVNGLEDVSSSSDSDGDALSIVVEPKDSNNANNNNNNNAHSSSPINKHV